MLEAVPPTLATPRQTSVLPLLMKHKNYYYRLLETGAANLPDPPKKAELSVNTAVAFDRHGGRWNLSDEMKSLILD